MKVITVVNDRNHMGYRLLRLSCIFKGLELVTLVSEDKEFTSNRIKDCLLLDYLASLPDDNETVLFSDGNDAIVMADENELLTKFYRTRKDLFFSTESYCWPDQAIAGEYPPPDPASNPTPYRFLNSGGFIGRVGIIKQLLEDNSIDTEKYPGSNQYVWVRKYLKYPGVIGIDTKCEIFHTFSPEIGKKLVFNDPVEVKIYYDTMKNWFRKNFLISRDRIFSKISGTWPLHAHFNGNAKVLMDDDLINMVLDMSAPIKHAEFIPIP